MFYALVYYAYGRHLVARFVTRSYVTVPGFWGQGSLMQIFASNLVHSRDILFKHLQAAEMTFTNTITAKK
jgi:hypothetical protein